MKRIFALVYGIGCYLVFLAVFLYLVAFVGDLPVPRTVDTGPAPNTGVALAVNVGLLLLFALQHSVMARRGFKERWTRLVPEHLERSTYVLAASVTLAVVMGAWRPMPEVVWSVENPVVALALDAAFWMGWLLVLASTFLIDHFDLFGLKQVWAYARGRTFQPPRFGTPGLYRMVRHPLYLGFVLAFWGASTMTAGRLLFAGVLTSWILLAIRLEEKDLVRMHGERYRSYQQRVRMLVPLPRWVGGGEPRASTTVGRMEEARPAE